MSVKLLIFLIIFGVAIIFVLCYFGLNLLFFNLSLSKNSLTKIILSKRMKKHYKEYNIDYDWFEKIKMEKLEIKREKISLKGNLIEVKNSNKLAIICHGYGADYREMSEYAKFFNKNGFNVFLPILRAHGESDGKIIGMGWEDRLDIQAWIEFLIEKNPDYEIVLFGLSMGATTICMTVGENLPQQVKCAISDCGYANAYTQFEDVLKKAKFLHRKIIMKGYNNFLVQGLDIDLKGFDAVKQLKKAKIPMLFIHGTDDEFVPFYNLDVLYNACASKRKYKYVCDGAKHAMNYVKDKKEYEKVIKDFLNREFCLTK